MVDDGSAVDEERRTGGSLRRRRRVTVVVVALVTVGVVPEATGLVGLPLPGPLRRYARRDLEVVAQKVSTGCLQGTAYQATIDPWRSRVLANGGVPVDADLTPEERAMVVPTRSVGCGPAVS